ncbi:MAG: hypothetical protein IPI38_07780 [Gemmatimonadetes bacterium]|nr:hypothetical protein [Gemmatimonadota bacterium]MBK6782190.1 hypothetical protein [Gemmatimonadota bacterium]MBK7715308.1 hypothetical protein [Gemmatimonadota bacterium]MBK7923411.1 hypothetical protein [Gemmatimonadota bacterium]MBK9692365.1 hypothetical protein [Gemmatimonadota bacterium]
MKRAFVLGGVLAALATAAPAAGQTEFGLSASAYSSYVWRGLSLTNKPVVQPYAYLSFPLGPASLTFSGWANVDVGTYDGSSDIAQGGGSSMNLSEFDPAVELGFSAGKASIALGGVGYIYPNDAPGITSDFNTVEVYGKVGLDAPLSPSLAVYYDVDKVKGLYVEGSVSHGIPLGATTLNLGALGGFSNNMDPSADDFTSNFADNGFTHLDLSASIDLTAGPLSITPALHFQFSGDDATKVTKLTNTGVNQKDTKIWGGVTISWSKAFGGEAEE